MHNPRLTGLNAARADIDQPWEQDNQNWWDWYVSLADPGIDGGAEARADANDALQAWRARGPIPVSEDALRAELNTPYPLSEAQCHAFRSQGYIKLKQVFSAAALDCLRARLVDLLEIEFKARLDGGIRDRFLSLELAWLTDPLVRAFVLSPRLGRVAAELLGVEAVRLYHDNVLSKEPGCPRTPWHYDDHHFPLATHAVVTAWIPVQPVPTAMGPLAFAHPIDAYRLIESIPFDKFTTEYDRRIEQTFAEHAIAVDASAFELGEVSFHHNLNCHSASGNHTGVSRLALANTYFVDGARVVESPTMVSGDWQKFMPGVQPGETVCSPLNPVVWPNGKPVDLSFERKEPL